MSYELIGALDQGTTSSRFILFRAHTGGQIESSFQLEHKQIYPKQGWVEHDPMQIWENSKKCMEECFSRLDDPSIVKAIGITNQRETTIVWDKHTGKPLHNAIVWMDMRTQSTCNEFPDREIFRQVCGLPVSTYFSGLKLKWLCDNVKGIHEALEKGDALFGTIDTWLLWNMTGGPNGGVHATDVTNASRTMLMNIHTCKWDEGMCKAFNIPMQCLPEIRSSSEVYGYYTTQTGYKVPVAGMLGDQQSALVGQACFETGQGKNTYGTGCFFMVNAGQKPVFSKNGLLTTPAFQLGPDKPVIYALEGSVAVAGAAVQWLRDNLQIIKSSSEIEEKALKVKDNGDVYFVPAFSGLFAPRWREDARGVIVGMTMYTNQNHICRAVMESICYQVSDVLKAVEKDVGVPVKVLKVDGGATVNNTMMQFQADILNTEVCRPRIVEITALGAEYAAGLAVGVYKDLKELHKLWQTGRVFKGNMPEEQRSHYLERWELAVEKSLGWHHG
eukprot:comp21252_c0_seq1/m.28961 comp21252_c0_seq1/g.28961  ORF comp21252_c0_seq1/g.28961 comp21252_c0_seq1/m.28961 type:complete len:501 (-) comp21252_c0_seq1:466-1968(-)